MSDLISRQAAIDDILRRLDKLKMTNFGTETFKDGLAEGYARIISDLTRLPSAQPDIIRCRNCKFASGDSRICMKFGHSPIGELDFCAWAERRTDE